MKPTFRFVEFKKKMFFFFFSCRKTLLGPVFGSPIEQIQILPVKSTLELQKRYMVFINRDKVSAFAVCLWGTTLCGVGSSQPQVASDPGCWVSEPSPATSSQSTVILKIAINE